MFGSNVNTKMQCFIKVVIPTLGYFRFTLKGIRRDGFKGLRKLYIYVLSKCVNLLPFTVGLEDIAFLALRRCFDVGIFSGLYDVGLRLILI